MWGYGFGPLSLCWFSSRHMQVCPLSSSAWFWSSASGVWGAIGVVGSAAVLLQVVQASEVKRYLAIPGCSSYHFVVWACLHKSF
ncbi:hypothetical protein U1Q18_023025 [Sarracenia purpurea var. burkii]